MRIFDPNRPELLNVGCGRQFHKHWHNVDLEACSPDVMQHNLLQGIPFDNDRFDAVYHSHVLEHLVPEKGRALIEECFRVLKPGGVLRIVVPDLEQITRLYLESHDRALAGDETAQANYNWMKLELLDQMVRGTSGGMMGPYMTDPSIVNIDFVRSRIGDEINNCSQPEEHQTKSELNSPVEENSRKHKKRFGWPKLSEKRKRKLAAKAVGWLLGKEKRAAFEESLFRQQGEIHRWMYDQFSLKQLCLDCGFESASVCSAFESTIEDFSSYQLDTLDENARKPDSLYMECFKPRFAQPQRMAA